MPVAPFCPLHLKQQLMSVYQRLRKALMTEEIPARSHVWLPYIIRPLPTCRVSAFFSEALALLPGPPALLSRKASPNMWYMIDHEHLHTCLHVYMYAHAFIHVCTCMSVLVCIYIHIRAHVYVCTDLHLHVCRYVRVYIHAWVHDR